MNKNSIITILGILVGLMAITLVVTEFRHGREKGGDRTPPLEPTEENIGKTLVDESGVTNIVTKTETISDGKTNTVIEVAPVQRSVERRPLEPEATKRLHNGPVIVSSVFEASGKGEYASYGGVMRGSYLYTTTVAALSEILEKTEDKDTGKVLVKERRKFLQSRDTLSSSDIDVALALDTLPVDQVQQWAGGICHLASSICSALASTIPPATPWLYVAAGGAEATKATVDTAFATLHKIDGTSVRGLLGIFGVKVPENIERFANERIAKLVMDKARDVHNAIQSIEGKSFIITYEQEKTGTPLNVDYKNEDGSPITDAEWEILRSANAFLDSNVVPKTDYRVGDSWTIWADEVMDMFGVAGQGRTEGKIRVERLADQPDGMWTLKVEQAEIEYKSDNGAAAGTLHVKDGNGLVDAENVSVKSLHATASGNLRSLDKKRHFLFFDFVKRIKGDSNLRFTLTVDPANVKK